MLTLRLGFGLFGIPLMFAASCGSDDAPKSPPALTSGSGGDLGGAAPEDGGSATKGGTANAAAGTEAAGQGSGGDGASSMTDVTDGWSSGRRLRAVLDVAGTAKLFKLWHDDKLGLDCAFAPDSEGVERCLPALQRGYTSYGDPKCTKPVAVFGAEDEVTPFALAPTYAYECGKGSDYVEVGATATGVTSLYNSSSGSCLASGTVVGTQIIKQLGAVVPPSTFVAASETVREARDSRLAANVRVAEDGSRQVASHFDLLREADCNPESRATKGYACVPSELAFIEVFFSDDKCSVPIAYHPGCHAEPTIILDASSPESNGGYFEVGAQVATPGFQKEAKICEAKAPNGDPGSGYYAIGKEVPWSDLAQLRSKNEGSGRIAITVLRGESDELVARQQFFDTQLNVNCSVGEAADLKTRCIPRTGGASVYLYADAKCSAGLYTISAGKALPDGLAFLTANAAGGGAAVFKVGAKVAPPTQAWERNGLTCEMAFVSTGNDFYATTSIAPAELALVTREVE